VPVAELFGRPDLDGRFDHRRQVPPGHLPATDCTGRLDLEPFAP